MLAQQINLDRNNHNAYANRSFILSRKCDWDDALDDALQVRDAHHYYCLAVDWSNVVSQHSGFLARVHLQRHRPLRKIGIPQSDKSIWPCVHVYSPRFKHHLSDSPGQGMSILTYIFYPSSSCQAIALFNTNQREEAMQRVKELANISPNADTVACHAVEVSIIGFFPSVGTYSFQSGVSTCPTGNHGVEWCASRRSCWPLHWCHQLRHFIRWEANRSWIWNLCNSMSLSF